MNGKMSVCVLLVCDSPIVAWGLERLLQSKEPELQLAGVAFTFDHAVQALSEKQPDIILIDIDGEIGPQRRSPVSLVSRWQSRRGTGATTNPLQIHASRVGESLKNWPLAGMP